MGRFKIPHVFIFLFWIIVVCSLLTYVIPSGQFERTVKDYGKLTQTVVVPGSYEEIPKHYSIKAAVVGEDVEGKSSPVSVLGIFSAIPKGLGDSAVLIFYVFIIGAVFMLIQYTGAINAFLYALIDTFKNRPKLLFFLIYMTIFSGASFMGIGPEMIALIPVFLLLSKHMGYDRMFGLALLTLPVWLGWSTGVTNPFTVQIAQIIAELPIGSGIGLRLVLYVTYAILGFYFIMRYGDKVRKDPSKSLMKDDPFDLKEFGEFNKTRLERKHIFILGIFVLSFASILFAVQTVGWGLIEMSACFIAIIIIISMISGMSGDESMEAFINGLNSQTDPVLQIKLIEMLVGLNEKRALPQLQQMILENK